MATLLRPDVYVNQVRSGAQSIPTTANLIGAMVGATRSGELKKPVLISSFAEFVEKFANGLDTPYMTNSMLAYSVYGFYANGGQQLYIVRVAHSTAAVAKFVKADGEDDSLTLEANNVGTWGNDLSLKITKSEDYAADNKVFDIEVTLGTSDSFSISEVTQDTFKDALLDNTKFKKWFNTDKFKVASGYELAEKTFTLTGGVDGVDDLTDSDYIAGIDALDEVDDVIMLACPGRTTKVLDRAMLDYGDKKLIHPILDFPIGTDVDTAKTYVKSISANGGAIYYPWLVVNDPLTDELKKVPTAGHVMGIYASNNEERGLGKAPAGTGTVIANVVDLEYNMKTTDIDILNPLHVNCICVRTNYGIVVWGARSLNKKDTDMRYVTDILINYVFTKALYNGTQFAVFEMNDEVLWTAVRGTIRPYLTAQWKNGVLRGETEDDAFYVVCDSSNNTDDTQKAGELHIEVGYAAKKPAEFVVINLAHTMQS